MLPVSCYWRMALPFRHLPAPEFGFFPGLRATLRALYAWGRAQLPTRARVRYGVLLVLQRLRANKRR